MLINGLTINIINNKLIIAVIIIIAISIMLMIATSAACLKDLLALCSPSAAITFHLII